MAERPVSYIVQQSRQQNDTSPFLVGLLVLLQLSALDNINELSGNMVDTDAVRKATVCGAGKNEIGKAQLANPAKPLKLTGIQ